jgi:hypothetical protein
LDGLSFLKDFLIDGTELAIRLFGDNTGRPVLCLINPRCSGKVIQQFTHLELPGMLPGSACDRDPESLKIFQKFRPMLVKIQKSLGLGIGPKPHGLLFVRDQPP